jgi:hypothetical protein
MRRSFLVSSGILYPEDCRVGEDFIFYLRAIMAGAKFRLFPEPGYLYTQPVGSLSRKRSGLSRTVVDHCLLEKRTLELASDPMIRIDPLLYTLLVARAEKIRTLRRNRELRHLLKSRSFLDLVLEFARHGDARTFMWHAVRRRVMNSISWGQAKS